MKILSKIIENCVLLLIISSSLEAQFDTNKIAGQWGGKIEYAERLEAINIQFNEIDNLITGNITLVYDKKEINLENILFIDSTISFKCSYDKGRLFFKGRLYNDILSGQIIVNTPSISNLEGKFELNKEKLVERDKLFIERLIKYAEYKNENVKPQRTFEYMDSSNSNLRELKNEYKLDSVAGTGAESSRLINLMKWVQNVLPYNGHCRHISPINSLFLIKSKEAQEKGINCNMKATILNEVYLAMGFASRVVHCLPKGDNFIEDHFITIVFSKELEKWIFMDPSAGVYLMDENKVLLSIQQFREKLIKGEKITVSDGALLPADLYLHYISKNLFRFQCAYVSGFNDTSKDNTLCSLYPRLYIETDIKDSSENIVSNPLFFWAKPE